MARAPFLSRRIGRCGLGLTAGAFVLASAVAVADEPAAGPAAPPRAGAVPADKTLVPGYFDAASGTFQKLEATSGTVTRTGTIKIVGTIVVNSGIPMSATISVTPHFRATFATTANEVFGATVTAKRTGARSATFSATLRYTCVVPADGTSANVYADIRTSAPGAGGAMLSWDGQWGTVVTIPANGKTLTVKADAAV